MAISNKRIVGYKALSNDNNETIHVAAFYSASYEKAIAWVERQPKGSYLLVPVRRGRVVRLNRV